MVPAVQVILLLPIDCSLIQRVAASVLPCWWRAVLRVCMGWCNLRQVPLAFGDKPPMVQKRRFALPQPPLGVIISSDHPG